MMIKKLIINDVKASSFKINKQTNHIYIDSQDCIIFVNAENLKEHRYEKDFVVSIVLNDKIWVANKSTFKTIVLDNKDNPLKNLDFIAATSRDIKYFKTEHFLYPKIYIKEEDESIKIFYAKIESKNLTLIKKYNAQMGFGGICLILNDEFFISKDKNKLALFNFTNELIWQHNFSGLLQSDEASLYGKILLSNNKLFFNLGDLQKGGLFCLEAKTGEVLQYFKDSDYEIFTDKDFIYTTKFENILCRINSKTLELEEWDCNALIIENGFENIHDHRCEAFNNKFYFTQTLGDNKAKLGILDWDKKQLVYKHNFEPQNGGIGSIQVNETRMFVHTQDNTLHIFKEEEKII